MNISIITTCKSRLHHLQQVIESWSKLRPYEIIVVDVKSPDGLADWMIQNYPKIKMQRLDKDGFNVAEARNYGAKIAKGDYLFFVDADVHLNEGLFDWLKEFISKGDYAVRHRDNAYDGIHEQGTVLVAKDDFHRIEGFDEVFAGYGGEDHDFYEKLERAGCKKIGFPKIFASSIDHSDEERTYYYSIKNKNLQSIINRIYRSIKHVLLSRKLGVFELDIKIRKKLWTEINQQVGGNMESFEGKTLQFRNTINKWLPPPFYLEEELTVNLKVKVRQTQENKEQKG